MRLKAAAPFAGILIALFLSNQVGVLLLQPLAGQAAVGYFAAAGRLFDSLTLIPAAIMGAFLPMMSQLYVTSTGDFVRSLRFTLKYLFIFSAPLLVLTVVAAQPILVFLYREAFLPSAPVLQLLGLALLFNFWNYANENALIARNQEKLVLYLTWGTAGLHVAANLMFIYWYSYVGAGWAVLATQAIYCLILFFILVRRYMSLGQLLRLVARPLAGALAMAGCLYFMRHWSILLSGPLSLMVYGGLLLALGAMPRQELDFFLSRKRAGLKQ
jgi:O-antigen/teichoic acid export membrane protein